MIESSHLLFSILRSVFHNHQMSNTDKSLASGDSLAEVVKLASKHDIAHLISIGELNNGLVDDEIKPQLQQMVFQAIYRYEKMNYELNRICEVLEKAQIPFIPLKGSVIRKYYPEPWMRTSCDIDILISQKNLQKAVDYLKAELDYITKSQGSHDVSLFSKSGVHLELHFDLVEQGRANSAKAVLDKVWDYVTLKKGFSYYYEMSYEMLYFYHIAHMAKHFESGGCGIRPFIDLWILDGIQEADIDKRDKLLQQGNLLKFANAARKLSRIWLENEKYDFTSQQMEDYILQGGMYGNDENRIAVQQQQKGGRFRYVLSKIFISYDVIKFKYPILQKHRWLTPFMEVHRWFKLIFCGHAKRTLNELKYNQSISADKAEVTKTFLENIGL